MGANPQGRKPPYAVESVDHALRLLQMLRDVGEVRGKEAARELHVAPSTVHRLMAMLVYRGFAEQDDSHVYIPGPGISAEPVRLAGVRRMRDIVQPHLEKLRDAIGETVYFLIGTGSEVRFILSLESSQPTRAGERDGFVLPTHQSAGGRAILAAMEPGEVNGLLAGTPAENASTRSDVGLGPDELGRLHERLAKVRRQGFALSIEEAEEGIACVAVPIRRGPRDPIAAISTAGSPSRLANLTHHRTLAALSQVREAIEAEVAAGRWS